jgi:hypothetical protein
LAEIGAGAGHFGFEAKDWQDGSDVMFRDVGIAPSDTGADLCLFLFKESEPL